MRKNVSSKADLSNVQKEHDGAIDGIQIVNHLE